MGAPMKPRRLFVVLLVLGLALLLAGVAHGAAYPVPGKCFPNYASTLVPGQNVTGNPISVKGAQNEHLFFLITLANADVNNLTVQLKRPGDVAWLKYHVYQWRPVPADLPYPFLADGLVPLEPGLIYPESLVHLALSLEIAPIHPPGTFDYSLVFQSGDARLKQPLTVKVWPYGLAADLPITFLTSCYYNTTNFARYGVTASELNSLVYPAYLSFLRNYKINGIDHFYPIEANLIARGKSTIEQYTGYTNMLSRIMLKYNFRYFRLPRLTGIYKATTMGQTGNLFESYAPYYYNTWYQYLSSKGWVNNGLVKVWDEPKLAEMPLVAKAYGIIKGAVPESNTECGGGVFDPTLANVIDNWAIPNSKYDPQLTDEAVALGQQIWLYTNNLLVIGKPPTHQRLVGWQLYKYDFSGYMLWEIAWFDLDPWTTIPGKADHFRTGTLIYPHPATGMPLPTLRLEALRRGLEDYQHFSRLNAAAQQGKVSAETLAAINQSITNLVLLPAGAPTVTWAAFEQVREQIGELFNSFNSVPLANSGSGQTLPAGTTVILDGSASSDPDGDALTYAWSIVSRPAGSKALLSDPAAVSPTIRPDVAGDYTMQLVVTDCWGAAGAPATVTISATPKTQPA
jgi:hypothetical protein